ncbi:hypothetical protein B0H11DRAFT_2347315 [Mycena galericulata]|nr:hypothetical protein B0H11DRAFT_2347315 [Mycena galericulata]
MLLAPHTSRGHESVPRAAWAATTNPAPKSPALWCCLKAQISFSGVVSLGLSQDSIVLCFSAVARQSFSGLFSVILRFLAACGSLQRRARLCFSVRGTAIHQAPYRASASNAGANPKPKPKPKPKSKSKGRGLMLFRAKSAASSKPRARTATPLGDEQGDANEGDEEEEEEDGIRRPSGLGRAASLQSLGLSLSRSASASASASNSHAHSEGKPHSYEEGKVPAPPLPRTRTRSSNLAPSASASVAHDYSASASFVSTSASSQRSRSFTPDAYQSDTDDDEGEEDEDEEEEDEIRRPAGLGRVASLHSLPLLSGTGWLPNADGDADADGDFELAERHVAPWTHVLATAHANSHSNANVNANANGVRMGDASYTCTRAISSPASTLLHTLLRLPLLPDSSSSVSVSVSVNGSANGSSGTPTPALPPALWRAVLQHAGAGGEGVPRGVRGGAGAVVWGCGFTGKGGARGSSGSGSGSGSGERMEKGGGRRGGRGGRRRRHGGAAAGAAPRGVRRGPDVCGVAAVGGGVGLPRLTHLHAPPAIAILLLECIAAAPPYTAPPTTPAVTADSTSTPAPTKKEGAHGLSAASLALLAPDPKTPSPAAKERRIPRKPPPAFLEHEMDGEVRVGAGGWGAERRWWWWRWQQQSAKGMGSPHPLRVLRIAVPRPLYECGAAAAGGGHVGRAVGGVLARGVRAPAAVPPNGGAVAGTAGVAFPSAFPVHFARQGEGTQGGLALHLVFGTLSERRTCRRHGVYGVNLAAECDRRCSGAKFGNGHRHRRFGAPEAKPYKLFPYLG